MEKKMWSLLVHLEMSMWGTGHDWMFDEEVWEEIVSESVVSGINTIVLDLGRGVKYGSHPEIACAEAWTRERVRKEVARLKSLGIELIPKLNFSATHDAWLGEYGKMVSTQIYYGVCRDLITEVYSLFDKPRYIHLGMDEEDARHCAGLPLAVYRQKDLIWHDLQFLCDCVRDVGATPWIWADYCFSYPEQFRVHISGDDILLSPWQYHAVKEENFTLISSSQEYIDYYSKEPYKYMDLTYVEDDPFYVRFRKQAIPATKDGYKVVPCVSTFNHCPHNTPDMVEYFRNEAPEESVLGYMTAPWVATVKENREEFMESIRLLKEARLQFYGEEC